MIATLFFGHKPAISSFALGEALEIHRKVAIEQHALFTYHGAYDLCISKRLFYFSAPAANASHRAAANEMQLKYLHCIFVSWFVVFGCGLCVAAWVQSVLVDSID